MYKFLIYELKSCIDKNENLLNFIIMYVINVL